MIVLSVSFDKIERGKKFENITLFSSGYTQKKKINNEMNVASPCFALPPHRLGVLYHVKYFLGDLRCNVLILFI